MNFTCLVRSLLFLISVSLLSFASAAETPIKFVAPKEARLPSSVQAASLADYGDYALFSASASAFESWQRSGLPKYVRLLPDVDRLLIDAQPFDTQRDQLWVPEGWQKAQPTGLALHLVQFVGPIQQDWLEQVEKTGAKLIHYIANHGYLIWSDQAAREALNDMAAQRTSLQFSEPYHSFFKMGPVVQSKMGKSAPSDEKIPVTIQMVQHDDDHVSKLLIESLSTEVIADWSPILGFQTARFELSKSHLQRIAELPDVYWMEEFLPRIPFDEIQNQILAADFNGDQSQPAAPGYLNFLADIGFPTDPAEYPVVVVVDSGAGNGSVLSNDPTFHELGDLANPTRLAFVSNCSNSSSGEDIGGHGHINTSIVGGYDERAGFPFQDLDGYQRGQGVNPFARIASTRIFDPNFDQSACGGNDAGVIRHTQDQGAKISTNSWGCSGCAGSYDDGSQAYDAGVRDSDPTEPLNQEMMHLFAAGNSGPGGGTVGTPGNGKNMLTVGASENFRPSDEDGNWTDGCNVGPTGADDAMDVIGFSSRGPSPGNRIKPETIAPGTHIHGTASTSNGYLGNGVCDGLRPSGQAVFAASSGTSHSTPAVAGLASLTWWWLENASGILPAEPGPVAEPSPALLKAYILAHPTYLTGVSANDTLPSNVQGFGMPNMDLMFDDTLKAVVNQDVLFDNSGETWQFTGSAANASLPVRVMLVYTDQPGAIGTSPQVNDLNLSVTSGGQTYLGNVFSGQWSATGGVPDDRNNYEAVFLPAGTASDIQITVSAFNIAGDGVPNIGDATDQDFALVCYNCVQEPTFTLAADSAQELQVCAPDDANYQLLVNSVLGFSDPVTLSVSGEPSGSSVSFGTNPINPPGSTGLTIGNTDAATVGSYDLLVSGSGGGDVRELPFALDLFDQAAGAAVLSSPVDGAGNVPLQPSLAWAASSQAASYLVEIATDSEFTNLIYMASEDSASHTVAAELPSNSVLYWRVTASNACGNAVSQASSFTTVALPGNCSIGSFAELHFSDDLESGATDWSHSGNGDTWVLQSDQTQSGSNAWHAEDVPTVSDQFLVSPSIEIPSGNAAYTLQFWNRQTIEDNAPSACWDGGMVQISTDDGVNWTQLPDSVMLTDPYDGLLGGTNPAAGQQAWCGDPQDWVDSIVDINAYAGETVRFRFRLSTDGSVGREGWYIDDIRVQSCRTEMVFENGFESIN